MDVLSDAESLLRLMLGGTVGMRLAGESSCTIDHACPTTALQEADREDGDALATHAHAAAAAAALEGSHVAFLEPFKVCIKICMKTIGKPDVLL